MIESQEHTAFLSTRNVPSLMQFYAPRVVSIIFKLMNLSTNIRTAVNKGKTVGSTLHSLFLFWLVIVQHFECSFDLQF